MGGLDKPRPVLQHYCQPLVTKWRWRSGRKTQLMAALTHTPFARCLNPVSSWTAASRTFASTSWQRPPGVGGSRRDSLLSKQDKSTHSVRSEPKSKSQHARSDRNSASRNNSNRTNRNHAATRTRNPAKMATRILVPDTEGFYFPNGTLITTAENAQFFRETGIESDHGLLWNLTHPDADKFRKMGIEVSFSNRYAIHPFHLRAFAPRGEPWAAKTRSQYRAMLESTPLWVHSMVPFSSKPAIVRHTCARRLAYCTHKAEELLAAEAPPIQVQGTVMIRVRDPIRALDMPAEDFQKMMVEALRKEVLDLQRVTRW